MEERFVTYVGGNERGELINGPEYIHVYPNNLYTVGPEGAMTFERAYIGTQNGKLQWSHRDGSKVERPTFNEEEQAIITRFEERNRPAAMAPGNATATPIIPAAHGAEAARFAAEGVSAPSDVLTSSTERATAPTASTAAAGEEPGNITTTEDLEAARAATASGAGETPSGPDEAGNGATGATADATGSEGGGGSTEPDADAGAAADAPAKPKGRKAGATATTDATGGGSTE